MKATEPSLDELKCIERELYREESTRENMQKLRAIEAQIKRHEREADE